jgi:hypothetical protein
MSIYSLIYSQTSNWLKKVRPVGRRPTTYGDRPGFSSVELMKLCFWTLRIDPITEEREQCTWHRLFDAGGIWAGCV